MFVFWLIFGFFWAISAYMRGKNVSSEEFMIGFAIYTVTTLFIAFAIIPFIRNVLNYLNTQGIPGSYNTPLIIAISSFVLPMIAAYVTFYIFIS